VPGSKGPDYVRKTGVIQSGRISKRDDSRPILIWTKARGSFSIPAQMKLAVAALLLICFGVAGAELEPNNTFSQANSLAFDSNGQISITGRVNPLSDLDVFKITTPTFAGRGKLVLRMVPTSTDRELDAKLQLYDAGGKLVAESDFGFNNSPETIEYQAFEGGRGYFVVCRSADLFNAGSGDYTLQIGFTVTPGLFGTIQRPLDFGDYPVQLLTFGATPSVIDPRKRTWIVIHGWLSSPKHENINAAALALYQTRAGDQVLTLDWSSAAATVIPQLGEGAIIPVASWAADALIRHGFIGTNLNLVGHSFGSYVCDEIAKRIPGGVNTIVTLDPAIDIIGGYSPLGGEVDFARDSQFSWSFHSSTAGNDYIPTTADEAFIVESGSNILSAHGDVVFLFAYLITHPSDPWAQYFWLNWLLTGTTGPWVPDQFASYFTGDQQVKGYEAIITTGTSGKEPVDVNFKSLPRLQISENSYVTIVSWPVGYDGFVLEASSDIGPKAVWVSLPSPEILGASNIVRLPTKAACFFRLRKRG
jgi:pimeloyl-ACP methyl ester carboxylesterase